METPLALNWRVINFTGAGAMSAHISDIPRDPSFLPGEWEMEEEDDAVGVKRGFGVTPRAQPWAWSSG